jgi:glycosyltransferase involved in cell wall biosynthesis
MMPTLPETVVSIIMPAFNAQRFLHEAVESILAQTFRDFEFLIMDDGSTDGTWTILQSFARADARIRLFQQENQGVAASLNYLFQMANSELIARMDADDFCHPDRLRLQVEYLRQHPDAGVLTTARMSVAPNGLLYCFSCPPEDQRALAGLLNKGINPITHGSVMMRKSVLAGLGESPYRLTRDQDFEDTDLWKKLVKRTTIAVLNVPLYYKREYSGTLTVRWRYNEATAMRQNEAGSDIAITTLDYRVAQVLKEPPVKSRSYETYLNARALYYHARYFHALQQFLRVLLYRNNRYKMKSLLFAVLTLSGPLGLYLFRRIMNKPGHHYQF